MAADTPKLDVELVDAAGRAIVIRAQVKNQDSALRPGMFARVRLITRTERDALMRLKPARPPVAGLKGVGWLARAALRASRAASTAGWRASQITSISALLAMDFRVMWGTRS